MNGSSGFTINPVDIIQITNIQEERKCKKKRKQLRKKDRKDLLSDKEQKQLKNIDISLKKYNIKKRLDKDIHKKNIIKFHKEKEQISDVKYGEIYIKNDDSYSKRIALLEMLKEQKKLKEIEEIKRLNYGKICKNRMIRKKNIALAMVSIEESKIGNVLDVKTSDSIIKATVVEKPFYDPKKKIASGKI